MEHLDQKLSPSEQFDALRRVLDAILETITESGKVGVPAGTLYSALMQTGASLVQFDKLMGILVDSGRVRKLGHQYFAVADASSQSEPVEARPLDGQLNAPVC